MGDSLDRLEEARVFSVERKREEFGGGWVFTEECDRHFCVTFTDAEVRALAAASVALVDGKEEGEMTRAEFIALYVIQRAALETSSLATDIEVA
jgi:hypothetical protein